MVAGRLPGDDLPHPVRQHHLQGAPAGERDLRPRLPGRDGRGVPAPAGRCNGRTGPRRRLTPVEVAMLTFGGIALAQHRPQHRSDLPAEPGQLRREGIQPAHRVRRLLLRGHSHDSCRGDAGLLAPDTGPHLPHCAGHFLRVTYRLQRLLRLVGATAAPDCDRRPIADGHPSEFGSKIVVGPTQHGLALASMLTIGLPFAVLPLLEARRTSATAAVPAHDRPDPGG